MEGDGERTSQKFNSSSPSLFWQVDVHAIGGKDGERGGRKEKGKRKGRKEKSLSIPLFLLPSLLAETEK